MNPGSNPNRCRPFLQRLTSSESLCIPLLTLNCCNGFFELREAHESGSGGPELMATTAATVAYVLRSVAATARLCGARKSCHQESLVSAFPLPALETYSPEHLVMPSVQQLSQTLPKPKLCSMPGVSRCLRQHPRCHMKRQARNLALAVRALSYAFTVTRSSRLESLTVLGP